METHIAQSSRIKPLVAIKALRRLIKDPEETEQVFVVIRALSGKSLVKGCRRFAATETGRRVLAERRALLPSLQDRDALRALPVGSLGRTYLDFVESEKITADGLVTASENETGVMDEDVRLFGERTRDQHDLWHTLTQYGRNPFGEACLLAFTYAQTRNRALAVITLVGMVKLAAAMGPGVKSAIWQGYLDGRRAAWLPGEDWEARLGQPIEQVRAELGIAAPGKYQEVFQQYVALSH
ncbi:MAG: Coq4 family protein [Pseudomonadales bacterium]